MRANSVELLESRRLLAAISWDGGGDGVNFTDPQNWSTNALPTANDDVTVDVPGSPALRLAGGTVNMRSLVMRETLRVETGGTLVMATTAQSDLSIELDGGVLQGGAWTFGFAGALVVGTNVNSRLQGVQSIAGDVLLNLSDASLTVSGGLSVNGTIRVGGDRARLTFSGPNTLAAGTVRFEGVNPGSTSPQVLATNGTLTLASGVVVTTGQGRVGELRGDDYVNRGTIDAVNSSQLVVRVATLVNEGSMRSIGGGSRLHLIASTLFTNAAGATIFAVNGGTFAIQGTDGGDVNLTRPWKNFGTINLQNGILFMGGTVRTDEMGTVLRTGGDLLLNGALDNTGRTFTPPPGTAPWRLESGRIIGGTVNMSITGTGPANRLVGPIVVNGDITLGQLTLQGGADLNGTATISTELTLDGSQTIAGGLWRLPTPPDFPSGFVPAVHIVGNATVTLGPDVTVEAGYVQLGLRFGGSGAGTLINEGLIDLRATPHALQDSRIVPGNAFINRGTVRLADGARTTVAPGGTGFLNEGLVQVGSTNNLTRLVIDGLFNNAGTVDVNALVEIRPPSAGLLASVADQTASGYAGGAWTGPGIRSSRAAASPGSADAVGYAILNTAQPVLQIRYTRSGDADANSGVNLADFNLLAANFGLIGGARWDQGDFNYDRRVNLDDFNLLAANFGGGIFAAAATSRVSDGDDDDPTRL